MRVMVGGPLRLAGTLHPVIQASTQAMRRKALEITDDRAVFPDATDLKKLEMMRDLDRKSRRVLNRIWTEIKLR